MGDRCDIFFKLGGKITKAQAAELIERMTAERLLFNETEEPCLENLDEEFWAEEVNYGNIEPVTSYCQENRIAYELTNGAGGSYGSGIVRFDGTRSESCPTDFDTGDVLFPLHKVLKIESLASGLADILDLARFMLGPFPNLEIEP